MALIYWLGLQFEYLPSDLKSLDTEQFHILNIFQITIFVGFALALKKKFTLKRFRFRKKISAEQIFLAFAGLVGVHLVSGLLMSLLGLEVKQFEEFEIKKIVNERPLLFFCMVSIVAPVYEEFIFRGLILRSLWPCLQKNKRLFQVLAVSLSSFAFAVFHKGAELSVFLLALYLSFLAIKTAGLTLPVIMHVTQNTIASLTLIYHDKLGIEKLFYFTVFPFG